VDSEDFETSHRLADEIATTIEEMRWEHVRPIWERMMGLILEGESDLPGALEHYRRFSELNPTDDRTHLYLGRCYRKLADFENAHKELALAVTRTPGYPEVLVEMALVENALGNHQDAVAHLDKALQVWDAADPDYGPAVAARDTLRVWTRGG
jgi:tetratricopeptide (TPR) repeat protein